MGRSPAKEFVPEDPQRVLEQSGVTLQLDGLARGPIDEEATRLRLSVEELITLSVLRNGISTSVGVGGFPMGPGLRAGRREAR